jgi:hypothetical protein
MVVEMDCHAALAMTKVYDKTKVYDARHCEERSDAAIHLKHVNNNWFRGWKKYL